MFRKILAEQVGLYTESMRYAQDYDLAIKFFRITKLANHSDILLWRRIYPESGISVIKHAQQRQYSDKRREEFINDVLNQKILGRDLLFRAVCRFPYERILTSIYLREYERRNDNSCEEELAFLKIKFIQDNNDWESLNRLGHIFQQQGRKSLAFMCFTESLRINPVQPEIIRLAELLQNIEVPRYKHLKSDAGPAVSIIMPTYNRCNEIKESIQSVLKQTLQDFELVIIDNGTMDGIEQAVKSFKSEKIRYFKISGNQGKIKARNFGIMQSRGKYIAYLDDDDIFYPNHLEILVRHIEKNNDCDFVYSNSWWSYGELKNGKFIERCRELNRRRPLKYDKRLLLRNNYISILNVLHKRYCLEKIGLFNEDLLQLEDWDFWIRLASNFRVNQINDVTGEYRWKEDNTLIVSGTDCHFMSLLVSAYYAYSLGALGLFKGYVSCGFPVKAKDKLRNIKDACLAIVKSNRLTKELYNLREADVLKQDKAFRSLIVKDYRRIFLFSVFINMKEMIKEYLRRTLSHRQKEILKSIRAYANRMA